MHGKPADAGPQLWAGVECSRNRVGERHFDQLDRTGHAERLTDLDLIADLGVRTLRYPVLWERVMPDGVDGSAAWSWSDERLGRLRELEVRPVVGLLHHGNGPRGTNLLDPGFPERFAAYARAVAERYPWVDAYVPINEPLTTARFAGLYGIWFPHRSAPDTFARILLNQLRGTTLAMRAIREVNPEAELIQNEDIGTIGSTPTLAERAAYENERRWLTFDLLCGRVTEGSPMWELMIRWGATPDELAAFLETPSPPDVIGVDHYLTSDRLLDERLERYPEWAHGGEDGGHWADVEAVRATEEEPAGALTALRSAWHRYGLPVALTEAHLGCTREEQVRWLQECWDAAHTVATEGADVRGVCVWMLFGGHDWNTLMTAEAGFYEAGAFDLRGGRPRPTAIARWMRDVAIGGGSDHPVLGDDGWWRRPERLIYPAVTVGWEPSRPEPTSSPERRVLVIVGEGSPLLGELMTICSVRGLPHDRLRPHSLSDDAGHLLDRAWAIVDVSGHGHPPYAEVCGVCDEQAPRRMAREANARGLPFLTFSADRVFAGQRGAPFVESVAPSGRNRWTARERTVTSECRDALVVRTGPLFGGVRDGALVASEWGADVASPTYLPDAVNEALDLLIDDERGVWHVANVGVATHAELLERAGAPAEDIAAAPAGDSTLVSERGSLLPSLDDALGRWLGEHGHRGFPLVLPEWLAAAEQELTGPAFSASPEVPSSTRSPIPEEVAS